jgi:hypothetical protein
MITTGPPLVMRVSVLGSDFQEIREGETATGPDGYSVSFRELGDGKVQFYINQVVCTSGTLKIAVERLGASK